MRLNPAQMTFSSGEVSPLLYGRTDYQRTQSGLRQCRGFLPLRQGPVTRAPGTIYRGHTRLDAAARLIAFQFAADDAVVLEFSHLRMRVWRYGELVTHSSVPYQLTTPYPATSLAKLKFVQSADVIFLVDGERPVQRLSRFGLDAWTIEDAVFERGPFAAENTNAGITVSASAEIGDISLVGVGTSWNSDHPGSLLSLRAVDGDSVPEWTGNTSVSPNALMRYDGRVYMAVAGSDTGVNPPVHTRGSVKMGADASTVTWQYRTDDVGIVRITGVTDVNHATAKVLKRLPPGVVGTATYGWAEGAWSKLRGWPSAIALVDERLALAATPSAPRTVWFSVVGSYTEMEPGVDADDAFAYNIGGSQTLNRVLWLQPGARGLHIGALGEEYSSRSTSTDQVIGPATAAFRADSSVGSRDVQPIAPDGRPIFISRDGTRLFELRYSFQDDATSPAELSLPAEHIGAGGFEEIAWQGAPTRIAWVRCGSGELAALIYDQQEDVLGWAPLSLAGGFVESLCVSPNAAGADDVVTLVVRRTIGGETVRHIEELAPLYGVSSGQPIAEARHLFAGVEKIDAGGFDVVNGLEHLEGLTVSAWTDHGELGPLVVSGGSVALGYTVGSAFVGLFDSTHVLETLDLADKAREGGALGRLRRVKGVGLRWHRTAAAMMRQVERAFGRADVEGPWRDVTDLPVPVDVTEGWSGILSVPIPSGPRLEVTQQVRPVGGAPLTLAGIMPLVELMEG